MPANFFSIAWPLALILLATAGFTICIAAIATLVAAITRARQFSKDQAPQGTEDAESSHYASVNSSHRPVYWSDPQTGVVETATTDGIHYTPLP